MRKLGIFFDLTVDFLAYLAGASLIFIVLSVSVDVALRFFLNRPMGWVVEVSEYIIVGSAFLAAAWVLKKEGHISVDVLVNLFKLKNRMLIIVITSIVGTIICLLFTWWGVVTTLYHFDEGTILGWKTLELPFAPLLMVIPIGFLLLFIQFIRQTYIYLGKWRDPHEEEKSIEGLTEV